MSSSEPRALATVTSTAATPFRSMAGSMVDHAAARHVDRWAPEHDAIARSGSLRSVAFVDRLIAPWFEASQRMAPQRASVGSAVRGADSVSWVLPRPWYQDELDWLAASRSAPGAGRPMLTTRGTYVASKAAAPIHAGFSGPMDLVAPSLSSSAPMQFQPRVTTAMPAGFAATPALTAWNPTVPFAAAQAAQLVAGALDNATRMGFGTAERSPILQALAYVTPTALAGDERPTRAPLVSRPWISTGPGSGGVASSVVQSQLAAAVARLDAVAAAEPRVSSRAAAAPDLVTPPAPLPPVRDAGPAAEAARVAPRPTALAAPTTVSTAVATTVAPTTVAPTTVAPTTVSPTTVSPTTVSPTAIAPTAIAPREDAPPSIVASRDLPSDVSSVLDLVAGSPEAASAFRTVDLLTRAMATGSSPSLAPASGPRVAMPAGLGGFVAASEAAGVVSRPLAKPAPGLPALTASLEVAQRAASAAGAELAPAPAERTFGRTAPAFVPVWASPPSALSAVASERPAAIDHVAWADRWLARFAGASSGSLETFDLAASERVVPRSLAVGAPEVVFVSPMFASTTRPGRPVEEPARGARGETLARPAIPGRPAVGPSPTAYRIDDADAVPDDVFAAIARARSAPAARVASPIGEPSRDAAAAAAADAATPWIPGPTIADRVASSPPAAPSAGLGASLASSPMAPALANLLPLPQVPSFDPRALFGAGIAAAYSVGLLAPALIQLARFAEGGLVIDDAGPASISSALASSAPAAEYIAPFARGPGRDEALPGRGALPGGVPAAAARTAAAEVPMAAAAAIRTADTVGLRTSLLAPPSQTVGEHSEAPLVEPPRAAWTPSPGMTAESAHAMAIRHERSTADLAFDFVAPELVLAARVYGFGPVEAAQAARLAVAGPGGLAAMATAVDLTFLRAVQERGATSDARRPLRAEEGVASVPGAGRVAAARPTEAAPLAATVDEPPTAPPASAAIVPVTAYPPPPSPGERAELFGVSRRLPRGAFLWPAGTVEALGLEAASSSEAHLPLAALELLAASAVADLGTWVTARGVDVEPLRAAVGADSPGLAPGSGRAAATGAPMARGLVETAASASYERGIGDATPEPLAIAQRARFETVYLALSRSSEGMSLSPSARVARALAVMSRSDETLRGSALERAAAAWSVLPVVIGGDAAAADEAFPVERRPGLSRLAAQAGGFLGAFVSPSAAEVRDASRGGRAASAPGATYVQVGSGDSTSSSGASSSAAPPVRGTGTRARFGGGEIEIPSWFEAAARSMFEQRGGAGEGISLAELTLIAAAPSTQIAAATKTASGPSAGTAAPAGTQGESGPPAPDVSALALEVYAEVLRLIDVARERDGEPYL